MIDKIASIAMILLLVSACQSADEASDLENAVAIVNDQLISTKDVQAQLEQIAEYRPTRIFSDDDKLNIVNQMVELELIAQQAVKENFHQDNYTVKRLLVSEYIKAKISAQKQVSDEIIRATYEKDQKQIDKIAVRHLLVKERVLPGDPGKKLAEELYSKVTDGFGSDPFNNFDKVAKEYEENNAIKKEDLKLFNIEHGYAVEFKEAAFALKDVGDVSAPIKTSFGWHIIQLVEDQRGFKKNIDFVTNNLSLNFRKKLYADMLLPLKEKATIQINAEKIKNVDIPIVGDITQ